MAIITSFQENKKQKYLFFLLGIAILGVLFFVWYKYLYKPKPSLNVPPPKTIDINFETLKNPILKELQLFEEIAPFEDQIGRENPFAPYETGSI